jgi:hypothetical protein
LDAPEPPQIVFELPAPCGDAARAEQAFRAALAPSVAPGHAWKVTMRVAREKGELRAAGEITDGAGAPVAHRTIDRQAGHAGGECAGLGRAIGVWASLVLDAEVQRAIEEAPLPAPPAPAHPSAPEPEAPPTEPPPEKPSPESEFFLAHSKEERDLEVGAASLAMSGTGTGMIAGGTIFEISEVGGGWFLRPSLGLGRSVTQIVAGDPGAYATFGAGRFDACKRIPGNYLDQRGLQLDICLGPEVGFLHFDPTAGLAAQTLPLLALGPSINFRGELGNALSVLVRGVADVNFLATTTADGLVSEALLIARAEVGLSWRLR